MPLAVVCKVAASLLMSLTIIPFLASRVLPRDGNEEGNAALRGLLRLIHGVYAPLLRRALAHSPLTVLLSALAFALSFALVPLLGMSLFPHPETPPFIITISTPTASNLRRPTAE